MKKRFLSAILALCMAFTLLPVSAMAEATAPMSVSGEAAIKVATEDALHAAITQVEDGEPSFWAATLPCMRLLPSPKTM